MLRILFSRAALFPWLGLVLMAAGAAFPDGNVVGIVLIVVGANVSFYSLRDFSQKFDWGRDSRSLLTLCGISFLVGLGLLALTTEIDHHNRWIATPAAGLYLCLFPVWVAQMPVGWAARILGVIGFVLMVVGGIFGFLGWKEWRVIAETEPTPQVVSLKDLLVNGHGTNRFVHLTDFRFCDRSASELREGKATFDILWIPIVPIDDGVKKDGPAPEVPARIGAVAGYVGIVEGVPAKRQFPQVRIADSLRKKRESDGYDCTVVTGLKKLKPEVQAELAEMAPDTDFSNVLILDWTTPASAERVRNTLIAGVCVAGVGLLAILFVYVRAWKAVAVWEREEANTPSLVEGEGRPVRSTGRGEGE